MTVAKSGKVKKAKVKKAKSKGVAVTGVSGGAKRGAESSVEAAPAAPASEQGGDAVNVKATLEKKAEPAAAAAAAVVTKPKPVVASAPVATATTAVARKIPTAVTLSADRTTEAMTTTKPTAANNAAERARTDDDPAARRSASPVPPAPARHQPPRMKPAPGQPRRAVSPIRRGNGASEPAGRFAPPLKAASKRLVVMRPTGPPDPTMRAWPYSFSGEYFKLLERGPNMGACDPSKNASYLGVVLPTKAVVAGFGAERVSQRQPQQEQQQQQQQSSSSTTSEARGAAAAAMVASLVAFSTAVGGGSSSSGGGSGGSAGAGDGVVATREKTQAFTGKELSDVAGARVSSWGGAAAAADARRTTLPAPPPAAGGNWSARIREAENELRVLQEIKIPRFVAC